MQDNLFSQDLVIQSFLHLNIMVILQQLALVYPIIFDQPHCKKVVDRLQTLLDITKKIELDLISSIK